MRRIALILLILGVTVGGSWAGYERFGSPRPPAAPDYDTVAAVRGGITSTVSATGTVLAERDARLSFQAGGTIARVAVVVGDQVTGGQLLAELDTKDLELAVRQAEVSVRTAQAQMQQLKDGPMASDLSAAQAALASAQANYLQVLQGSDADQLAAAHAQVDQARVALDQAQQAYDKVKDFPNVGMLPQSMQLQQATINYETAQAQYRVTSRGANQAQVAAAQAQVAQAQATLDKLQRGPSAAQLEVSQAAVDQAQIGLEQAQRRLENARLEAPWDGVVTAVNLIEGTPAQVGAPAIQLADNSRYHIDVLVDEADVASIADGQPVSIELDAFSEQNLSGRVAKVAPTATVGTTGVVSYLVTIHIDPTSTPLRGGMSATATITSHQLENVLLVPNRAVQLERSTGRTYVERLEGGVPKRIEVQLGLRNDQQSQVVEGLADGDLVVIRNLSSLERLMQASGGF